MKIDIKELYPLQEALDKDIAKRHHITYKKTFYSRLLALLVELGEFANETRCFKYWSFKKPSEKKVILEEYADGLHFILSLGIALKVNKTIYEIKVKKDYNLVTAILDCYSESLKLKDNYSTAQYIKAMNSYLNIIGYLKVRPIEVKNAYLSKLKVNYNRQETKY